MLKTIYYTLEKPYLAKYGFLVQNIILLNIIINIFSFTLPLLTDLDKSSVKVFDFIQDFTVVLFMIELVIRYIAVGVNPRYNGAIGRFRYTFKFYTIVDILAIIPFFLTGFSINIAYIRGFRFIRLLKLIRMRKVIKKFFSLHSFAMSKINTQMLVLFTLSGVSILLFGYIFHSADKSFLIFVDPPGVLEVDGYFHRFFAVLEWILGLFVGGALISIITSSLVDVSKSVQDGYLSFKDDGHIVIIGSNKTLEFILKNINQYYIDHEKSQDVVLFLPYMKNINQFRENLKHYANIDIIILAGGAFHWNSYERMNINKATKLLILNDENIAERNHNIELTRYILVNKNFTNKNLEFTIQTRFKSHTENIQSIYAYMFDSVENPYLIVSNNDIMKKFLNRSIVDNGYFAIFLKLLSFESSEFYLLDAKKVFKKDINFIDACMSFQDGVIMGVAQKDNMLLNPDKDTIIGVNDKVIAILKNSLSYFVSKDKYISDNFLHVKQPNLRVKKNICIVGDNSDIGIKDISHFLTNESVENYIRIIRKNGDYMYKSLWEEIKAKNNDIVILNLEDKYEFIITMYLKNIYKNDTDFLSKIVNIIHDPTTAKLLSGKDKTNNIILSDKIIGQYISLVMFNPYAVDIFDEVTDKKGSEFYILKKSDYEEIFKLSYNDLKYNLIQNNMIYIGAFRDNEFRFNHEEIRDLDKILVLAKGA